MFEFDRFKLPGRYLDWGLMVLVIILGTLLAVGLWFRFTAPEPVKDVGSLEPVPEEKMISLEIIYDLSGSMWGKVDGKRKYEIGQEIIKEIIATLPDDVALGLRLLGATRENDPWDTTLVVRPQLSSRDGQIEVLEEVRPKGMSPLGFALQQAGKDLEGIDGEKHIILVTDGRDNGMLPPVKIVRELREKGIKVHIFDVERSWPASAFLQTLSEVSGGKYFTQEEEDLIVATFAID